MPKINVKPGEYYYAPHRSSWGVWRKGETIDNTSMDDFIGDFPTKEKAKNFVYKANNWL